MPLLDLYKSRPHNTVKLIDPKTKKAIELKLPNEYTVEEVERLLELQGLREKIESQSVVGQGEKQLQDFWQIVFDQLEILFQHFQPEMSREEIKRLVTHDEALRILGFYQKYRYQPNDESDTPKKKA